MSADQHCALSSGKRLREVLEMHHLDIAQMPLPQEPLNQEVVEVRHDGVAKVTVGDGGQARIGSVCIEGDREPLQESLPRTAETSQATDGTGVPKRVEAAQRQNSGQPTGRVQVDQPSYVLDPDERARSCGSRKRG
jgi:hypothetical protein